MEWTLLLWRTLRMLPVAREEFMSKLNWRLLTRSVMALCKAFHQAKSSWHGLQHCHTDLWRTRCGHHRYVSIGLIFEGDDRVARREPPQESHDHFHRPCPMRPYPWFVRREFRQVPGWPAH